MSDEKDLKVDILRTAGRVTAIAAMAMNRHDRRRLGRENGNVKIPGTIKPIVVESKKAHIDF